MLKRTGFLAVWSVLILLAGGIAAAEDPASPDEEPAGTEPAFPVDASEKGGIPFALYVGVAGGTSSAETISTTIFANQLNAGVGDFTIDEQVYGKAEIGWKLPNRKGDFRFVMQGVKEEESKFRSVGASTRLTNSTADLDSGLVPWWFIDVGGGTFTSKRIEPTWTLAADMMFGDGDGIPDFGPCTSLGNMMTRCGEILYNEAAPTAFTTGTIPEDFQNRIVTYDLMYGREFGGRRFSSRWWGGLRYFQYEGQILATAWLSLEADGLAPGEHFTDGSFLPFLKLSQETTGAGPVGSWEFDVNFRNRALQLYARAEAAFTVNSMTMDSGPFFQILDEGNPALLLEDRLSKNLDKSSWQDRLELGGRLHMKNGLTFEIAFAMAGYLDFVLMPNLLQTGVTNEDPQTNTQDIVIESVHGAVGFQF